jgi:hypothetical protein
MMRRALSQAVLGASLIVRSRDPGVDAHSEQCVHHHDCHGLGCVDHDSKEGLSMVYPITVPTDKHKFHVVMVFETAVETTPLQLQNAILRAVRTKAFGIPGTILIETIQPVEVHAPLGPPSRTP